MALINNNVLPATQPSDYFPDGMADSCEKISIDLFAPTDTDTTAIPGAGSCNR